MVHIRKGTIKDIKAALFLIKELAIYENAEEGFQEKYFELLKAGGTKHHSELLKPFGLDASDPDFWKKGLSIISGLIDELEELEQQS